MRIYFIVFCSGWFVGAIVMWLYFLWAHMLRTRQEWYAAEAQRKLDAETRQWIERFRGEDHDYNECDQEPRFHCGRNPGDGQI